MEIKTFDELFMRRCIELSQLSVDAGDAPFGSLIAIEDKLLVEGLNDYKTKVTEHAEIVALNKAHQALGSSDLSVCTLYTSCEPCPMCSFMIREFKIKRVVFALHSPHMGGYSKWSILEDEKLGNIQPFFAKAPIVLPGYLEHEAKSVMDKTVFGQFFGK